MRAARSARPPRRSREARPLGAEATHAQLELDRHIALAAAHDTLLQDLAQRLVGQLRGGADARQLGVVLDLAQVAHQATARHQLPTFRQQLAQASVLV